MNLVPQRSGRLVRWAIVLPDGRAIEVRACTKSEARALVKRQLGFGRHRRLPVGAVVRPIK